MKSRRIAARRRYYAPAWDLVKKSTDAITDAFALAKYNYRKALQGKLNSKPRHTYQTLNNLLKDELCPCAFLDLEAFDKNLDWIESQMQNTGKKVRIGTKSLRVPALIHRALERDLMDGLFLYHPNEIQFWQEKYKIRDFLLAYPIFSRPEAELLCDAILRDPKTQLHVMVDSREHLKLLEQVAKAKGVHLGIIIDCDFSIRFAGQTAGVLRSPLQQSQLIIQLAKAIEEFPHLDFNGIMGYEAQEAGIGDFSWLYRTMKKKSREAVDQKRDDIVSALTAAELPPKIVNGGGSGCFQQTAHEPAVTEVTIGSGLFKSYIFDPIKSMDGFLPSLYMGLRVIRFPRLGVATCYSGGYVSSAINKPPKIVMPENCRETVREGFGEVQTPIRYDPSENEFKYGDIIICRFAKAGEPLERFQEVLLIKNDKIIDRVPTYRGAGLWLG